MNTNTPRLVAAAIAYAAGVLLTAQFGTPVLDTIAAAATSTWRAVGAVLGTAIVGGLRMASDVELLIAVLGPLAFLAMAAILGLIVWPATVDHVPNTDPAPADASDAKVLPMPTRRRASAGREAA